MSEPLVFEILQKAKRGIYRPDLLLWFSGNATQKEIAAAIREAKSRGMYSVPDMRSVKGDTFYQYDEEGGKEGGDA